MSDIAELRKLEEGWDTYGGLPPSDEALDAAEKLIGSLTTVPLNDGGVQVESHAAGFDVEIGIASDGSLSAVYVERACD